jgi:hypothetical protein
LGHDDQNMTAGQNSRDKRVKDKNAAAEQLGKDNWDRTGLTRMQRQDSRDKTVGLGQPIQKNKTGPTEFDSKDRTTKTGQPGQTSCGRTQPYSPVGPGHLGHDTLDWTAQTSQSGQVALLDSLDRSARKDRENRMTRT